MEVCDVELDEGCVVLVRYSCEPVGDGFGVLPLVLNCSFSMSCVFILSCMSFLIFPISDFEGLINRYVGLVLKFGLWSLLVMKTGCSAVELF